MKNMNKEEKLMDKKISASYEATKTNEEINDKRFENTPLECVIMIVSSIFIVLTLFGIWYLLRKSGSELAYSKNDYVYYFKIDDTEYYVDPLKQKLRFDSPFPLDSFSFFNIGGKSGYAYIPNQNNRKTVVTFVTEDGYEITTDNFMMKKILRENIRGEK